MLEKKGIKHDFIMQTKSGKTILIETKGDHLDGSDSEAKCRLGNEWERQAGQDFAYFMVFDKKEIKGAYRQIIQIIMMD